MVAPLRFFSKLQCASPPDVLPEGVSESIVFKTLRSEILGGVKDDGSCPDVLNKILLSKEGSGHFPDDAKFMQAFEERGFCRIAGYKYYLFDCLENGDNLERVNVVDNLRDGSFGVEHIMPQTLSASWQQDLGTISRKSTQSG